MEKDRPTMRMVHVPSTASALGVSKPWTVDSPPPVALNWTAGEKQKCVAAANKVLDRGGSDQQAVFACIRAAGKTSKLSIKGQEAKKMNEETVLKVVGDRVTLGDLARAWLGKAERFTSVPWSDPAPNLSPEDYAKVCLIDLNPPGEEKKKGLCKLPIRATPGGPTNINALRAAAGSLGGSRGQEVQAPEEAKAKAARELVRLMRSADMQPGEDTLRRAGLAKSDFEFEFAIVKADVPKRVVYGIPLRPDVPDSQKDSVNVEEIEAAAWNFMIKSQRYDEQHEHLIPKGDVCVVESFLAPVDFELNGKDVAKGSWVLASKVFSDDIWKKIEKGEISAYSIKGRGNRTPTS